MRMGRWAGGAHRGGEGWQKLQAVHYQGRGGPPAAALCSAPACCAVGGGAGGQDGAPACARAACATSPARRPPQLPPLHVVSSSPVQLRARGCGAGCRRLRTPVNSPCRGGWAAPGGAGATCSHPVRSRGICHLVEPLARPGSCRGPGAMCVPAPPPGAPACGSPAFAGGRVARWCQTVPEAPLAPIAPHSAAAASPRGEEPGGELGARRSPPAAACPRGCLAPCRRDPRPWLRLSLRRSGPWRVPRSQPCQSSPGSLPGWLCPRSRGAEGIPVPAVPPGLRQGQGRASLRTEVAAPASPASTGVRAEPLAGPCRAGQEGQGRHRDWPGL